MLNWSEVKNWLKPIDKQLKVRETQWVCSCSSCQNERFISYAQAFNIIKGKSERKCRKCREESGEVVRNVDGLKLGRKYHKRDIDYLKPKLTLYLKYKHIFGETTQETRQKQRSARLGKFRNENHPNWQGGKTKERILLTMRDEYKQLRVSVFKRDNYTCQICNIHGGKLEMDHIKEWCNYPDLRFESTNCRTLCKDCHKKTDNYGSKAQKKKVA